MAIPLKNLIEAGCDKHESTKVLIVNYIKANGPLELKTACRNGDLDLVKFLIEHGVDIQSNNNDILEAAFEGNNIDIIKFLIEKGAELQARLNTFMYIACGNNNMKLVKLLMNNGFDIKNVVYSINVSCEYGHLNLVKFFIEQGADVNQSLLLCSVRFVSGTDEKNDRLNLVKFLVEEKNLEITEEVIKLCHSGNRDIKSYLEHRTNMVYYGIVSNKQLEIQLPELVEINKNNKYYYVYKGIISEDYGYVIPELMIKHNLLTSIVSSMSVTTSVPVPVPDTEPSTAAVESPKMTIQFFTKL